MAMRLFSVLILVVFLTRDACADADSDRLFQKYPHLRQAEGAVIERKSDGTSLILAVGMVTVTENEAKAVREATMNARLRVAELVRGANVKTAQRMNSDFSVRAGGNGQSADFSQSMTESTNLNVTGGVRNASTVGSWKSADGQTLFVALLQRNDVLYLPDVSDVRVGLSRGVDASNFILPELRGTRGEMPNGEQRKRDILDGVAAEVRDSVLETMARPRNYIITSERETASVFADVTTDSLKVKISGTASGGKRSVSVSFNGTVRFFAEGSGQDIFKESFSASSPSLEFLKTGDFPDALSGAKDGLLENVRDSLRVTKCSLLSKLSLFRVVRLQDRWMLSDDVSSSLLREGDLIGLWTGTGSGKTKVGEAVVSLGSGGVNLDGFSGATGAEYFVSLDKSAARGSLNRTTSVPGRQTLEQALSSNAAPSEESPVGIPGSALFKHDSADLGPDSLPVLQQIALLAKKFSDYGLVISGYTDSTGTAEYNRRLSQRRADVVREWLVGNASVAPARVEARGRGTENLIVPAGRSVEEQAPNRRVEVTLRPRKK